MAIAVQEPSVTDVDHVLSAVASTYTRHREIVTEMLVAEVIDSPSVLGSVRAMVVPSLRTIEVALDDELEPDALVPLAWHLVEAGWEPVVLVPLHRLGEAHLALRGVPCVLQGWWAADESVVFTGPERP